MKSVVKKVRMIIAGVLMTAVCIIAPQQLKAEVPEAQMDGVMGQSMEDETTYDNIHTMIGSTAQTPSLLKASAATGYTDAFIGSSFSTKGKYTGADYYHKADYKNAQLLQGIDVSWWQAKNKKTTLLDWNKIHAAGVDYAFVRAASRDTADGTIYEDTAADSHIQAAQKNDINIGLYIFSQALTEQEAQEEAKYVLNLVKKYGWDVTLPIVIDREKGSYNRLTEGKLSKTKETAVCQAFADTITKAGYRACVYASYSWIKSYINSDRLDDCSIWIARYNNTTTSNSRSGVPYADAAYDYEFWQYSSIAKISGYTGNLDANFWYKNTGVKTTGLKAATGGAFDPVALNWSKAERDVTGYRVYRYDKAQDKYVYIKSVKGRSCEDTTVMQGTFYQYKVRCYWTIGGKTYYGTYSSAVTVTVPPAKVTGITTKKRSSTYLNLSWDKVNGASGYRVYQYDEKKKAYKTVKTLSKGENAYTISNLSPASEYRFKVKAYKKTDGIVTWGTASAAYYECTNPLKVRDLGLSTKASSITLTWGKVSGVSGYQVYCYNSKTKKFEKIATIKGNAKHTYTHKNLKKNVTCQYKVRAYRSYKGNIYHGAFSDIGKKKVK